MAKRTTGSKHLHRPGPMKVPVPESFASHSPLSTANISSELARCGSAITPACLRALYHIPNATRNDDVNALGLYEAGDTYAQEDLDSFFAKYAPNVPQGTHPTLDSVDGGEAPVAPGSDYNTGESDIDMDIAYSLIYVSRRVLKVLFYTTTNSVSLNLSFFIRSTISSKVLWTAASILSSML